MVLITRHIAGSVLALWLPLILHAFRAMQRKAVLQKHGHSNLHGLTAYGTQHANEEKAIGHQSYHFALY